MEDAKIPHITGPDGSAAVLQVTDPGLGDQQAVDHLPTRQATDLAEPAQLRAQPTSPDGRVCVQRHGRSTCGSGLHQPHRNRGGKTGRTHRAVMITQPLPTSVTARERSRVHSPRRVHPDAMTWR